MSHVGAHIGAVPLSSVTRQILKGVIDRVRGRQAGSMTIALHSGTRLMFGRGQIGLFDANPRTERQLHRRSRHICFVGDRHHQRFGVVALRAFESP
jgi:hypothetical protein